MTKIKAHVLDGNLARRARLARSLFENGVHAEIYDSVSELSVRPLKSGYLIAHHDALSSVVSESDMARFIENIGVPVSLYSEEPDTARTVRAMLAGAVDYLDWPITAQKLSELIGNGEILHRAKIREMAYRSSALKAVSTLTAREYEALRLVIDGHSSKSAARIMDISPRTVEIHRANAFQKVNARSVADAVRIGLYAGLHHQ